MAVPDFWKNREAADEKIRELGILNDVAQRYREIESGIAALARDAAAGELDADAFHKAKAGISGNSS